MEREGGGEWRGRVEVSGEGEGGRGGGGEWRGGGGEVSGEGGWR